MANEVFHRVVPATALFTLSGANAAVLGEQLILETNMTGDYSITPQSAYMTIANGALAQIDSLTVEIVDTKKLTSLLYTRSGALTNGVLIDLVDTDDNLLQPLTPGPLRSVGDYVLAHFVPGAAALEDITLGFAGHLAFKNLFLDGIAGHRLRITLADDFTDLVQHRFCVAGQLLSRGNKPSAVFKR